jgi:hypothetical protein
MLPEKRGLPSRRPSARHLAPSLNDFGPLMRFWRFYWRPFSNIVPWHIVFLSVQYE